MADTCVLGHEWTPGRVLCATCGFGPRSGSASSTATLPAQAEAPALERTASYATVGAAEPAASLGGGGAATAEVTEVADAPVLSPDGQWAWDGERWVPAADLLAAPAAVEPDTGPMEPVAAPRKKGFLTMPARKPKAAREPAPEGHAKRSADPKLLVAAVVVLAAAAGADYALHLPPLGHQAAAPAAPVVTHHTTTAARTGTAAKAATGAAATIPASLSSALTRTGAAEVAAYPVGTTFTTSVALLRAHGATVPAGQSMLVAANASDYCLVGGSGRHWWIADGKFAAVSPTAYATAAAAEKGCTAGLGAFRSLG